MSIAMLLDSVASALPDRVLIGAGPERTDASAVAAAACAGAHVVVGAEVDAVGFIGIGGPAFPTALFASALAGVAFTPMNYRLPADRLAELATCLGARPMLIVDDEYADVVKYLDVLTYSTGEWLALLAGAASAGPPAVEVDDDAPAVVLYTSGTTAKPKGAVLRHRHLTSYVLQTVEFASAAATDAALISVPPYHVAGVGTVLTNIFAGRRLMYLPSFTPGGWLDTVREEAITQAMLVPTMLARIAEHLGGAEAEVPCLRSLAYGGARMPRPVLEAALRAMPKVAFANAYGLTETSSTIAILGPEDHREALISVDEKVRARLGSVGRLLPGIEGRIRADSGAELPAGEPGQLWVRGEQVAGEYLGDAPLLDSDGWFHTRDQAWIDPDGYLYIVGRSDDTIIRGGENIAPAEIEDVLVCQPGVKEVAVVGVPDDEWGARILVFVVRQPGATVSADEVKTYARARLRGSRTPDDVAFVSELPHTPTGKLIRRELPALVRASVRS